MVAVLAVAAVCLLAGGCTSCGGGRGESRSGREVSGAQAVSRHFPKVTVPDMIASGPEAAEYAAEHWWDGFTDTSDTFFCDPAHVNGVPYAEVEQAFADYCPILESVSMTAARRSMTLRQQCSKLWRISPKNISMTRIPPCATRTFISRLSRGFQSMKVFPARRGIYMPIRPKCVPSIPPGRRRLTLNFPTGTVMCALFGASEPAMCCFSSPIQAANPAMASSGPLKKAGKSGS